MFWKYEIKFDDLKKLFNAFEALQLHEMPCEVTESKKHDNYELYIKKFT